MNVRESLLAETGAYEIPEWMGLLLDRALYKAAGHKYIRRVPTGKPGRYKYYYSVAGGHGIGHESEMVEGAAFRMKHDGKEGHFHVIGKTEDGKLRIKHDESGHETEIHADALRGMLHAEHAEAINAHRTKLRSDLAQVSKTGSAKQRERLKAEAAKYGVHEAKPKVGVALVRGHDLEARGARLDYLEAFGGDSRTAGDFEDKVLAEGRDSLPAVAQSVLDGSEPTEAYWRWLKARASGGSTSMFFGSTPKPEAREPKYGERGLEHLQPGYKRPNESEALLSGLDQAAREVKAENAAEAARAKSPAQLAKEHDAAVKEHAKQHPRIGGTPAGDLNAKARDAHAKAAKAQRDAVLGGEHAKAAERATAAAHEASAAAKAADDAQRQEHAAKAIHHREAQARHEAAAKGIKTDYGDLRRHHEAAAKAHRDIAKEHERASAGKGDSQFAFEQGRRADNYSKQVNDITAEFQKNVQSRPQAPPEQKASLDTLKNRLRTFASKDPTRGHLQGIKIEGGHAFATDGARLVMTKAPNLPEGVHPVETDAMGYVTSHNYPDVRRAIPAPNPKQQHVIDAPALRALAVRASKMKSDVSDMRHAIQFVHDGRTLRAQILTPNGDVVDSEPSIMVGQSNEHSNTTTGHSQAPHRPTVDAGFLADALKGHKGEAVLQMGHKSDPVRIDRGDETHVIMPRRL